MGTNNVHPFCGVRYEAEWIFYFKGFIYNITTKESYMRFSLKRQQGFTLIEIIIVVVILGILAAIALPKITSNIDKARAAEAFQTSSTVTGAFQRCVDEHTGGLRAATNADVLLCNSFAELNLSDPSGSSQSFNYTFDAPAGVIITMTATGKFAGFTANDTITFAMSAATGTTVKTCNAAGIFAQMCKN